MIEPDQYLVFRAIQEINVHDPAFIEVETQVQMEIKNCPAALTRSKRQHIKKEDQWGKIEDKSNKPEPSLVWQGNLDYLRISLLTELKSNLLFNLQSLND